MVNSIPLKCSSCGSSLEITSDIVTFACGYCGAYQLVERKGGVVYLKAVADSIGRVQVGTDKTAAELALNRLNGELQAVEHELANVEAQRSEKLIHNRNLFCGILLIGFIIFLLGAFRGDKVMVIALILTIVFAIPIFFLWSKQDAKINRDFSEPIEALLSRGDQLYKKIAENRKIID